MTPLSGWWTAGRLRDDDRGSPQERPSPVANLVEISVELLELVRHSIRLLLEYAVGDKHL